MNLLCTPVRHLILTKLEFILFLIEQHSAHFQIKN